jgi:hypothetical protein
MDVCGWITAWTGDAFVVDCELEMELQWLASADMDSPEKDRLKFASE